MQFKRLRKARQRMVADRDRFTAAEPFRKSRGRHERVTSRTAHRLNSADQMDVRPDHSEVKASARADIAITDLPVMESDLLSLWTALPLQADKLPDICSASISWLSSRYRCKWFLAHGARSTDSSVSFALE